MLAEFFMQDDTVENWKQGFVLLHNYFSSIYIRNPVLLCASQDWFQVQSTPRTTFRQEGEDDADMEPCLCPCVVHGLEKTESRKVFQVKKEVQG
jgi:sulfur transfer protein SufE